MTFSEVVDKVDAIYAAHGEASEFDAEFDGGEFSVPAHDRMAEKEVRALCILEGVSYEDVQSEIARRTNEYFDEAWPEGSEPGQNPGGSR